MDDIAADLGELIFSLLISYVGALEFFFVLRHLCHFSGHHPACNEADNESLQELKEKLQRQLDDAKEKAKQSGKNTMQDGVPYKDGFRIDPDQAEIDKLKEKINAKESKEKRRAEIQAELARQKQIEEETRRKLEQAEAELARERAKAAEEAHKEKQQQEQQDVSEEAENFRKLLEAEKQREAEQRKLQEEAENQARIYEEEKKDESNLEKLLEEEKKRELQQKEIEEAAEQERKINSEIRQREKEVEEETETGKRLLAAEKANEDKQRQFEESGSSEKFLAAEQTLKDIDMQRENKQKVIKENARKFLEAEQEMVQLQQKMLESIQYGAQVPVVEEPVIKRTHKHVEASAVPNEQLMQTVKTQFGQRSSESFTLSSKPLLFPSLSDDASSNEPHSSKQSSFSTQPSEEITTGTEEVSKAIIGPNIPRQERQEPDGEDNAPSVQYTEDYLRSLDGLKVRPLTREDGSGRRRAFKKRRSSGSSNSSRESRTSREEELKMFTSLEEEELKNTQKGDEDFTPIKYTNEPAVKVKGHHHRRHKRSPAKDTKTTDDGLRTSLEMLGEEGSNPWGEVVPEHYKNTEFWQREKAMSIDEEEIELESTAKSEETRTDVAVNEPNSSSFEEATVQQNQEAITTLQKQLSKDPVENDVSSEPSVDVTVGKQISTNKDANLQSSQESEGSTSPSRTSASPRLRRSPRIDEINQYEERWKELESSSQPNSPTTPTIALHSAEDVTSWRDEHGLIMQGLSDFYDFTASVNPSRSRSTSRNPSPASSPIPEDMSFRFDGRNLNAGLGSYNNSSSNASKSSDNSGNFVNVDMQKITTFIESFHDEHIAIYPVESNVNAITNIQEQTGEGKQPSKASENIIPAIFVECNENENSDDDRNFSRSEMNQLIESLRENQRNSRSRSRSPLPTADNIEHSLKNRRLKLIQHNDELIESLPNKYYDRNHPDDESSDIESNNNREKTSLQNILNPYETRTSNHNKTNELVESVREKQRKSRSRSRSPLPSADNIERCLENRRLKLIRQNDEIFENLVDKYNERDIPNDESSEEEQNSPQNICKPDAIQVYDERRTKSRSPFPARDSTNNDINCLVESLRANQRKSRSRSRSPLPTRDNIERSLEIRRSKLIQHNDELFEKLASDLENRPENTPTITIDHIEEQSSDDIGSREDISSLVASLRVSRSRSRSKSPMRIPNSSNLNESISHRREKLIERNDQIREHLEKHALDPKPPRLIVEYVYEIEESVEDGQGQTLSDYDIDRIQNQVRAKDTDAIGDSFAEKQRNLDEDALDKLKNAKEETELRTLTPLNRNWETRGSEEESDILSDLPARVRLQQSICSPSTPDYDRTISEEWRDVQRIKNERLSSGFKRSKYVGESMELGSEYEQLRREAATFRRSKSPSPSIEEQNSENLVSRVRQTAAERRQIQDNILKELISISADETKKDSNKHGAKPKTERKLSEESGNNSEFYEEMRREMAEFRRSRSCSRSPTDERNNKDLIAIDIKAAERELQDQILDKFSTTPVSFQDFSRHLNANFLDDRRASDSAVIHKPDMPVKYRENSYDLEMEAEEYHHYRRFSLNQEQQIEEYPNDDFMYISEIKVRSLDDIRTWIQGDYYSTSVDNSEVSQDGEQGEQVEQVETGEEGIEIAHDEEETEDSEDERQTVVEVDDEIDTDICDFNERGPTDESHHEQSECEEAERAMDHYANCEATDWQSVNDLGNILETNDKQAEEEGAVGGMDSDSFEIDQIYDEAIKNRKQSGILREYDSILLEMQKNIENNTDQSENKDTESDDKENYSLWAKTRTLERGGTRKLSVTFLETEKHDTDLRYLGDAKRTARQSTRLRSRYGFVPQLKSNSIEDFEADVNYKPKREYNWRKNFRLDDEDQANEDDQPNMEYEDESSLCDKKETFEELEDADDSRKYSLGGESITLFSRSPERANSDPMADEEIDETKRKKSSAEIISIESITENKENTAVVLEKPKKKKIKKKAHREAKENIENRYKDEDDSDSQVYSRPLETESPKRKSRSRRGSRSSITNDDSNILFSPRSSIAPPENTSENIHPTDVNEPTKKKVKKRKKTDVFSLKKNIKEEQEQPNEKDTVKLNQLELIQNGTTEISLEPPKFTESNKELSSKNRVVVSKELESYENSQLAANDHASTTTTTLNAGNTGSTENTGNTGNNTARTTSSIDTFDILKDANFYPLF